MTSSAAGAGGYGQVGGSASGHGDSMVGGTAGGAGTSYRSESMELPSVKNGRALRVAFLSLLNIGLVVGGGAFLWAYVDAKNLVEAAEAEYGPGHDVLHRKPHSSATEHPEAHPDVADTSATAKRKPPRRRRRASRHRGGRDDKKVSTRPSSSSGATPDAGTSAPGATDPAASPGASGGATTGPTTAPASGPRPGRGGDAPTSGGSDSRPDAASASSGATSSGSGEVAGGSGAPAGTGGIDPEASDEAMAIYWGRVSSVVRKHDSELKRCYRQAAKVATPDKPLQGRIEVRVRVKPSGGVEQARISKNTTGYPRLADCVLATMKRWSFPPHSASGALQFLWPFEFSP